MSLKYLKYLSDAESQSLSLEVVSTELKVHLTRLLCDKISLCEGGGVASSNNIIIRQNKVINKSRNLQNLQIYTLETDDEYYLSPEYAWHNGEFELVFRRLDTVQFIEFLGDLIEREYFTDEEINSLLEREGASFRYQLRNGNLAVEVMNIFEIENAIHELEGKEGAIPFHGNVRLLFSRAENALAVADYTLLVHCCASIFETLAKDVISDSNLDDKSLGSFFEKYRKESSLPEPILNFILDQYKLRGKMPLAGHGSTITPPVISKEQAVTLIEMTKAFVITEYRLSCNASLPPIHP